MYVCMYIYVYTGKNMYILFMNRPTLWILCEYSLPPLSSASQFFSFPKGLFMVPRSRNARTPQSALYEKSSTARSTTKGGWIGKHSFLLCDSYANSVCFWPSRPQLQPLILNGLVSLTGDQKDQQKVQILRDTGAAQSFILSDVVPFSGD